MLVSKEVGRFVCFKSEAAKLGIIVRAKHLWQLNITAKKQALKHSMFYNLVSQEFLSSHIVTVRPFTWPFSP